MKEKLVTMKIVNKSNNPLPKYESDGASGMDLRANLEQCISLKSMERKLIPTGLFIELTLGYEAQIRPRSGLAFKNGITCLNSPGTIDCDYRGEIKVLLVNLSNEVFEIQNGDRIAQLVICPVEKIDWEKVDSLTESQRAERGFGSTGI